MCRCERIQILLVSIQLFSSSMCVQEEKKNELSNKSKQYPTNNKRFSLKVPRADWVSILNLKTRLSHVNFFIYRIIKSFVVGRYLSKVSTFFRFVRKAKFNDTVFSILNVLCSIDVDAPSKPYPSKEYKTVLYVHVWEWYWSCMALQRG